MTPGTRTSTSAQLLRAARGLVALPVLARAQPVAPGAAAVYTGTYSSTGRPTVGRRGGCVLEVQARASDSVRVFLSCVGPPPEVADRQVQGVARLVGGAAVFGRRDAHDPNPCEVRVQFGRERVTFEQTEAGCGLGEFGVPGAGTLRRVSARPPAFAGWDSTRS